MVRQAVEIGDLTQPQVFVSYARQDAEQVLGITRLLEQEGATVWRDGDHILGGQYYGEQIVHAIAHSKVVMLMCSPQAFQSDNVHREVLLTWDHYHRRYIPVWLCPATDIPERFRYCLVGCQWIDAHSQPTERWLPQLLKALRALGVETTKPGGPLPGEAAPRSADVPVEPLRRKLRFKPGDRPIQGADWVVERLLGKGGFGEVWKAHNPHLSSMPPVALKFCLDLDERSRELLHHEADMVLRAQRQIRSAGIVPLLHAYLNNDPPCLEFPYIEGGTLVRLFDECREQAGSFAPSQAQRIVHRIAQIVAPAHRAEPRLIHRDLKPSNVLVERRAEGKIVLRVTDFGIGAIAAQPVLDRSRATSSLEGNLSSVLTGAYSPLYASPQQMQGDKPDPRDDVYALGVIWYQLLKGDLASPAPTGRRWMEMLRGRGMSDAAIDLLSSCFESDPAYRPADAGMLAEQLRALAPSVANKAAGSTTELPLVEPEPPPALEPSPEPPAAGKSCDRPKRQAARIAPRPPKITGSPFVSPAPHVQHAETPATSRRFGPSAGFRRLVAAGALGLAGLLGVILYIATDNGTIKISGTDSSMKVQIDGQEVRIENLGKPITIRTGPHKLLVTRDNLEVKTDTFRIRRGEETVLEVTYTPNLRKPAWNDPAPPKPAAESPAPASRDPEYITTRTGQIKLKRIPAGTFLMGSPDDDKDAYDYEKPQHRVRISQSFYLGVYEVTQAQYETVMGYNPSWFSGNNGGKNEVAGQSTDRHPVENVSWLDAVKFCNKWGDMEGVTTFYEIDGENVRVPGWGRPGFRLPTEAEWEYACRANAPTVTRYSFGDNAASLGEFAWYIGNSGNKTHPVGEKRPNGFGLFDMHGNVWEWCWDGWGASYYKESREDDPRGPDGASARVIRGGCWNNYFPRLDRSASRQGHGPGSQGRDYRLGFRLALVQSGR